MRLLFLLIFLFNELQCSGQSISILIDSFNIQKYTLQVKQLDQFIKRFNNEENIITGNEKTKLELSNGRKDSLLFQNNRRKILLSLLNLEDKTLFNDSTIDFIKFVSYEPNKVSISYYDEDWFATVNCKIIYKGKNKDIILTLKNEGNITTGFKWVIAGINADFINIKPLRKDTTKFISPMNHELGFMDLYKVFSDSKSTSDYTVKNFIPDDLSIFLFLVKSGEIKYVQVNTIKYHFLQVKDWRFTVEYFNRDENNSGWLISSLTKCDNKEKIYYKRTVLSLNN